MKIRQRGGIQQNIWKSPCGCNEQSTPPPVKNTPPKNPYTFFGEKCYIFWLNKSAPIRQKLYMIFTIGIWVFFHTLCMIFLILFFLEISWNNNITKSCTYGEKNNHDHDFFHHIWTCFFSIYVPDFFILLFQKISEKKIKKIMYKG